jgi:hypothetical protein
MYHRAIQSYRHSPYALSPMHGDGAPPRRFFRSRHDEGVAASITAGQDDKPDGV